MTNDEARQHFKDCGLDYSVLTKENIRRLRIILADKLKESGLFNGTYRMNPKYKVYEHKTLGFCFELTCRAYYFDKREAITFNHDGFIGFAGWASSHNVAPIIGGFIQWCKELVHGGGE